MSDDQEPYTGPERRRDDLATRAEELSDSVKNLNLSVVDLTSYGRRNRALIRINIVALIVIVVLFVAVGIFGSLALQNRQNAKLTCQIGNESRAGQLRLWNYVLDASSANPNLTPQQRQTISQFRAYIEELFSPRDCSDLTPVVKTPTPPIILIPTLQPTPTKTPTPTR